MQKYKRITIVDVNDNVIGYENFFDALEKGCIRRASVVFIRDTEGKHLIQKRSDNVSEPLLFDTSVGGHVDQGDTYIETAIKESGEEMGLRNLSLIPLAPPLRTLGFFVAVYTATIPQNTDIQFDMHEVESIHWMTTEEIDTRIIDAPQDFTKNFVELWTVLRDKLIV